MSERTPQSPERNAEAPRPTKHEAIKPKAESAAEKLEYKKIDKGEAAKAVEAQANSSKDIMKSIGSETSSESTSAAPTYTNAKLADHGYRNIMRSTQRKLSPINKRLSRVIHVPAIEKISESTSKTIARPSAFLGGAVVSLIGSIIILLIARRNGFVVSPVIFPFLFAAGYFLGLLLDTVLRGVKKSARR